jgi:hypothetical protein
MVVEKDGHQLSLKIISVIIFMLATSYSVTAQLHVADFEVSDIEGCTPFVIDITNIMDQIRATCMSGILEMVQR